MSLGSIITVTKDLESMKLGLTSLHFDLKNYLESTALHLFSYRTHQPVTNKKYEIHIHN